MAEYSERIKELEEEVSTTKYNKRTQHHVGLVKAKIAALKEKQETSKKGKKEGEGYSVKKSGDATVVLLGFPSVGKSSLLNKLTNAESKVAAYEFTTLTVIPGLMEYNGAKLQILDIPGIIEGAAEGKGRGKEIFSVIRAADLIIILVDVLHQDTHSMIEKEVYEIGLRLNQRRPDVRITKTSKGGIHVIKTRPLTRLLDQTIKGILQEFRIINADILIRQDIDEDQLIDVILDNRIYVPSILILNKIDLLDEKKLEELKRVLKPDLSISAEKAYYIHELKELIFRKLNLVRIYTKQPGIEADMSEPLVLKHDTTIRGVCDHLHRDFARRFSFARVWGSARFPGLRVNNLEYPLKDKDILELHLK
jgi:small GTP-binding protein